TDRMRIRKNLIVMSYLMTTILLISFLFTMSDSDVILLFSLISFISAASATPLNLMGDGDGTLESVGGGFCQIVICVESRSHDRVRLERALDAVSARRLARHPPRCLLFRVRGHVGR